MIGSWPITLCNGYAAQATCMHYTLQAKDPKNKNGGGAVAIRHPYLRVVGLEDDIEGDAHNSPTFRCAALCDVCFATRWIMLHA